MFLCRVDVDPTIPVPVFRMPYAGGERVYLKDVIGGRVLEVTGDEPAGVPNETMFNVTVLMDVMATRLGLSAQFISPPLAEQDRILDPDHNLAVAEVWGAGRKSKELP